MRLIWIEWGNNKELSKEENLVFKIRFSATGMIDTLQEYRSKAVILKLNIEA